MCCALRVLGGGGQDFVIFGYGFGLRNLCSKATNESKP